MSLWVLYGLLLKATVTSFSGMGSLPQIRQDLVVTHSALTDEQLSHAVLLGRSVPGDVSVTGFDDLPEARWPLLQLTTVAFDLDAMARRAASLLVDRIQDGPLKPYRHEWFPSHLVERGTLGPPA